MAIALRSPTFTMTAVTTLVTVALLSGCGRRATDSGGAANEQAAHDEHDHGEMGPHDGHIIELGTEDYHAELTHDDDSHRVGVYLLGGNAKTAKPIDAESVTINVAVDGEPTQYVLPAAPQPGETAGKSSYFELVSEPLSVIVAGKSESRKTHARLSLTIEGKPFVGLIETEAHDHDHGHAH